MAVELVGRPADGDPDAGLFHSAELENILRAVNGGGVLTTSISATVTGTSRVITVPAFNAWVPDGSGGLTYVAFAGSTVTMDAADATNPRTDIIHLSSAGTLGETAGVATALSSTVVEAPMPDLPAGTIMLGKIAIPAAQAYVLEADINGRAIDVSEQTFVRPLKISETTSTIAAAGTTETINLDSGTVHDITLDENVEFTFSNPVATGRASSFTLILRQDGTGTNTVTWPASVEWPGGSAPTMTAAANAVDIYAFVTVDGGTTWYGFISGQAFA